MTNVSRTNKSAYRPADDFYGTPAVATHSFVAFERQSLRRTAGQSPIWEPAAGEGWLAAVLNQHGFATIETDRYRHIPMKGRAAARILNFFDADELFGPVIITNPPYKEGHSGDRFVRHALSLRPRYAAFFLPITFLASIGRRDILDEGIGGLRHARTLIVTWRCSLAPKALLRKRKRLAGVTTYAWIVFERGHKGPATEHRLYRVNDNAAAVPLRRAA